MGQAAVLFDFDGTLTRRKDSVFYALDRYLGEEVQRLMGELRDIYLPRHHDGTITPAEEQTWWDETFRIYREAGLRVSDLEKAVQGLRLREGVEDCLLFLQQENAHAGIVSYGLKACIEIVLRNHSLIGGGLCPHISAAVHLGDGDQIWGCEEASIVFPSRKRQAAEAFRRDKAALPAEMFAVGDAPYDAHLAPLKENTLGVAEDSEHAAALEPHFGTVVVLTDGSFAPVISWLMARI